MKMLALEASTLYMGERGGETEMPNQMRWAFFSQTPVPLNHAMHDADGLKFSHAQTLAQIRKQIDIQTNDVAQCNFHVYIRVGLGDLQRKTLRRSVKETVLSWCS